MANVAVKLTYEDYLLFPENDDLRHELIEGEHEVTPAPGRWHQHWLQELGVRLYSFVKDHGLGWVYFGPFEVKLSNWSVVEPDLLFVSRARGEAFTERGIEGPPDLVVEALSPSTRKRDQTRKLALYEKHGVREYWILDHERQRIVVYRLRGEHYDPPEELVPPSVLRSPLLPGLEIPLATLFAPAQPPG
ncbi:MAG TPA: Uma2 family endonuclease [Thermoanaerobaculia bacterium]|nr:Uma2 family endonuclease [Thermoanaerobaculia bacterium]